MALLIHTERMRNWCTIASRIHGLLRCGVAIFGIVQVQVACFKLASVFQRSNFNNIVAIWNYIPLLRLDAEYDVEAIV